MPTSATLGGAKPRIGPGGWRSAWVDIGLFAAGAGLLAFLICRIGAAPIAEALASLGLALPLIVGVEAFAVLANTLSWRCTIAPEHRGDVPFTRLVAARIVGDAANYVITAGVGEISKVRLLARYLPMEPALTSVALAKITEGIALGLFGILGLLVAWPILAVSTVSGVTIAIAVLVGVGLVTGGLVAARIGVMTIGVRLFRRLVATQVDHMRLVGPAMPAEAEMRALQQGLLGSTVWHLVGWLVNVGELWVACHVLGLRPSWGVVFGGEALGVLFDAAFFFVPMRIGAAEGGRMFVFRLLGFGAAAGLALGLVRRIRELAWAVAGLVIYAWLARGDRRVPGRGEGQDRRGSVATA